MNTGGDGIRVVHPLFQGEGDGAIPISPLQLHVSKMPTITASILNQCWHSRLPNLSNWQACFAYGAVFANRYYAIALWGPPVARMLNGRGWMELRRMAIADDAPQNTASRMLKVMRLLITRDRPDVTRFISYQDTGVHKGTIYKAAGWKPTELSTGGEWTRPSRNRTKVQAETPKQRWELTIRPDAPSVASRRSDGSILSTKSEPDLFAGIASINGLGAAPHEH